MGVFVMFFLVILVTVDALLEVGVVYRYQRAASSEQSLNLPIFASEEICWDHATKEQTIPG